MKNPPPKNPRVNDTWIDDDGELRYWDGAMWSPYEDPAPADRVVVQYRED